VAGTLATGRWVEGIGAGSAPVCRARVAPGRGARVAPGNCSGRFAVESWIAWIAGAIAWAGGG
jgi:hypothetical protein